MKRKILKFQNPAGELPVSFRGARSKTMKSLDADGNDVSYTLYGFNHPTMGLIWADPNLVKNGQYRYFTDEDFDDNGLIKTRSLVENSPRYSYLRSADYDKYLNSPWAKTHPNDVLSEEQFYMGQDAAGSITEAKKTFPLIHAINNYFGEMNYNMQNGKVMEGKHFWPMAAMAATGIGGMVDAPVVTAAALGGGYGGSKVWDLGNRLFTGNSWADNMYNLTGLNKEGAELINPGMWRGTKWGLNSLKRGIETAMRTGSESDPLPAIAYETKSMLKGQEGGKKRLFDIGTYILTGKRTGPKGHYNSFASFIPEENLYSFYGGFMDHRGEHIDTNDIIDAYLYGKEVNPEFGIYRTNIGENFGEHTNYIDKNYPWKKRKIQVYSTEKEPLVNELDVVIDKTIPVDDDMITATGKSYDAAGHGKTYGNLADNTRVAKEQDIWKFNPKDYTEKWLTGNYNWMDKFLLEQGLKAVDQVGTPVIVRSGWEPIRVRRRIK